MFCHGIRLFVLFLYYSYLYFKIENPNIINEKKKWKIKGL